MSKVEISFEKALPKIFSISGLIAIITYLMSSFCLELLEISRLWSFITVLTIIGS
jgi:hypothetical protein